MSIAFGTRQPCDTSHCHAAIAGEVCAARDRPWVLAVAVLGSSLAFIEGSVVNLALPALQSDLQLDSAAVQWVINVYLLVLGAFLLIGGAAGDRFGLRRVFSLGVAIFGVASLACALTNSLGALLMWRAIQGFGAALLIPASLALITYHFDKDNRGHAIGIWAGASALTTAIGPVVGGALVDLLGWASVFLAIAPLALITLMLTLWRVPKSRGLPHKRLDYVGALLLVIALGLFTYGIIDPSLSTITGIILGVALIAAVLFVLNERRAQSPMLPLSLFNSRVFSGANMMTFALYFALSGALFFVPFNLIQIQGYSTMAAGAAFLPMTLMLGFGSAYAGDLISQQNPRKILAIGSGITAIGFAALAVPSVESQYWSDWLPGIVLIGLGMTLCVAPLTTVVMGSVDDAQAGVASGVNNTAARVAGMLAIAVLSGIAVSLFASNLDTALLNAEVSDSLRNQLLSESGRLAELSAPSGLQDGFVMQLQSIIKQSYVSMFRSLMLVCAAMALLSAFIAWGTLGKVAQSPKEAGSA